MQTFEIGAGIDLDFGASQPSAVLDMNAGGDAPLPFQAGGSAIAVLSVVGWIQAEQNGAFMALQGSDFATTEFATIEDVDGNQVKAGGTTKAPVAMFNITIPPYLRLRNLSLTAGDGYGSAYLLQQ
jgi:hypothetical protein